MAPFPESESMTIKRLEVALRKDDMQLLKDGAYKLHEKFHTGHRFEFTQELEHILNYVNLKDIPLEVKEILCPTIEEILKASAGADIGNAQALAIKHNDGDVRVLGQNSTGAEASAGAAITDTAQIQEPSLNEIAKENTFEALVAPETPRIKEEDIKLQGDAYEEYMADREAQETINQTAINFEPNPVIEETPPQVEIPSYKEEPKMQVQSFDDVAIFYDDASLDIDYTQIKDYRNKLNNLFSRRDDRGDYNLLKEIASILNITDTKVSDLDKILSVLCTSKNHVSLITTSQSQEVTKILSEKNIDFEIPFVKRAQDEFNSQTLIPMLGFSNIFVCSNCNSRSLKSDFSSRTLSIQCPQCDSAAFPDVYAVNSYNPDCNPIFWHRAFRALVKAKIWIMINPPLDENKEIIFDFIKMAADCSKPERIYLLSKESDKREFYRQMFKTALPECDIRSNYFNQEQLCEDYIKVEITNKVFG